MNFQNIAGIAGAVFVIAWILGLVLKIGEELIHWLLLPASIFAAIKLFGSRRRDQGGLAPE